MKTVTEYVYSADSDITFVMDYAYDDNDALLTAEVKGFHFGEPANFSQDYHGKLKATFNP